VDVVVFTKIDRISRNVVDFLTLVEEFERYDSGWSRSRKRSTRPPRPAG
jgi:hypothetical protein